MAYSAQWVDTKLNITSNFSLILDFRVVVVFFGGGVVFCFFRFNYVISNHFIKIYHNGKNG